MDPKKDSYKTKEDKFIVLAGLNRVLYSPSFGNSASRYKFVSHLFSSSDCHGTYPPEFYTLKFKNDYDFSLTLIYGLDGNIKDMDGWAAEYDKMVKTAAVFSKFSVLSEDHRHLLLLTANNLVDFHYYIKDKPEFSEVYKNTKPAINRIEKNIDEYLDTEYERKINLLVLFDRVQKDISGCTFSGGLKEFAGLVRDYFDIKLLDDIKDSIIIPDAISSGLEKKIIDFEDKLKKCIDKHIYFAADRRINELDFGLEDDLDFTGIPVSYIYAAGAAGAYQCEDYVWFEQAFEHLCEERKSIPVEDMLLLSYRFLSYTGIVSKSDEKYIAFGYDSICFHCLYLEACMKHLLNSINVPFPDSDEKTEKIKDLKNQATGLQKSVANVLSFIQTYVASSDELVSGAGHSLPDYKLKNLKSAKATCKRYDFSLGNIIKALDAKISLAESSKDTEFVFDFEER